MNGIVSACWEIVDADDPVVVAFNDRGDGEREGIVIGVEFRGIGRVSHVKEDLKESLIVINSIGA